MVDPRNGVVFHAVMNWKHRQDKRANIPNAFLRTSVRLQSIATAYHCSDPVSDITSLKA